jgi:hypothetical protein
MTHMFPGSLYNMNKLLKLYVIYGIEGDLDADIKSFNIIFFPIIFGPTLI